MIRKLIFIVSCFFISITFLSCSGTGYNESAMTGRKQAIGVKPFRVLVIIGDQWTDPLSYNIDPRHVKGSEFTDVVTMLKIWGIPFDVLRLDQQRLQINRFLDGEARANYGCMIWMADPDILEGASANFSTLKRAVEEYGISMIALFDNIKTKEVADLVGVSYQENKGIKLSMQGEKFSISGKHFITCDALIKDIPDSKQPVSVSAHGGGFFSDKTSEVNDDQTSINLVNCTTKDSTIVLGTVGNVPQLVVRDLPNDTRVIWIGGGMDWFRKYPVMKRIFRKSIVYAIGYGVFNDNFDNGFIFAMDDAGAADHAWFSKWHYPTPPKDTLTKYLIEPLEKRGLIMVQFVTPGYANPVKKMVESPWTIKPFKDMFGNWQDYGSTKEGLDDGLRRGVFEIQPHRAWSHMNWDLDSPPGPWWGSTSDGEMANYDWYVEAVDIRRGIKSVPSNDLLFIYKTGIDAVKKSFGVTPVAADVHFEEIENGAADDVGRVAAIAGLGVSRECYLSYDKVIEFSMMYPEEFYCHEIDLTEKTNYPADDLEMSKMALLTTAQLVGSKIAGSRSINLHDPLWMDRWKKKHWMGYNEVCAYLHSIISDNGKNGFGIEFSYDNHYCRYFEKKPSNWTLELSDSYMEKLGNKYLVNIDGQKTNIILRNKQKIEIPAGLGKHRIELISK
jgi:hypothetical protein